MVPQQPDPDSSISIRREKPSVSMIHVRIELKLGKWKDGNIYQF